MNIRRWIWCRLLELHRWDSPGGNCEDCGFPDTLWDHPDVARRRLLLWKEP